MLDMVKCPFKLNFDDLKDLGPTGFLETPMVYDINGYDILFAALPYECDETAKPGSRNGSAYFRRDILASVFAIRDLTLIWRIA